VLHLLDQRLDRREAGAAGQQHDRLRQAARGRPRSSRRKKLPNGPSARRMSLLLERAEDVVGELAAGHVAHVQLDRRRAAQRVRRVGHAVAAPRAVAQDELDVLPGAVAEVLVGRQLQRSTITSGAARSSCCTRVGIFSTGCTPSAGHLRASTTQSLCGVAQQVRMKPAASSSATDSALLVRAVDHRPSSRRLLQEPQAPSLQP
jgi:hypothetical protein